MDEHLAQVLPDQLVELAARRMPRSTTLLGDDLGVPPANVVAAAVPGGTGVGALAASPATDPRPEQVPVALVVARGEPTVVGELFLNKIEGLPIDDLRDRDGDPLLLRASLGGEARTHGL